MDGLARGRRDAGPAPRLPRAYQTRPSQARCPTGRASRPHYPPTCLGNSISQPSGNTLVCVTDPPDPTRLPPQLGELLALLHGAEEPFETVRATYRIWRHHERAHVASQAAMEERKRRGAGVSTIQLIGGRSEAPVEHVETMRIWRAGDRVREEVAGGPRDRFYGVRAGEKWWHSDERSGALSNENDATTRSGIGERLSVMLDPTPLLGSLRFRPLGRSRVAGRATLTAEGLPRPEPGHGPPSFELHQLGLGADRYTLEVDAETGRVARRGRDVERRAVSQREHARDRLRRAGPRRAVRVRRTGGGGGPLGGPTHKARARAAHRGPAARAVHRAHARPRAGGLGAPLHVRRGVREAPIAGQRVTSLSLRERARSQLAAAVRAPSTSGV